jgi:hypothetical protein
MVDRMAHLKGKLYDYESRESRCTPARLKKEEMSEVRT